MADLEQRLTSFQSEQDPARRAEEMRHISGAYVEAQTGFYDIVYRELSGGPQVGFDELSQATDAWIGALHVQASALGMGDDERSAQVEKVRATIEEKWSRLTLGRVGLSEAAEAGGDSGQDETSQSPQENTSPDEGADDGEEHDDQRERITRRGPWRRVVRWWNAEDHVIDEEPEDGDDEDEKEVS